MYDMNFFSVYKKRQAKSNSLKIFLISLLAVVVLLNAVLIGGGLMIFGQVENNIQSLQSYISDEATQKSIKEAEKIKQQADLTLQYLNLLTTVDGKLDQLDFIDTALLDQIRQLTPANTVFTSAQIIGLNINLTCESSDPTGPMDMYHAFKSSPLFANVVMANITVNPVPVETSETSGTTETTGPSETTATSAAASVSVFTLNCLLYQEGDDEE